MSYSRLKAKTENETVKQKVFDSINRSTIIQALKEMQIPVEIVKLVNMVTQHIKAKIKLNNEYTEQIDVKTGIKQEDPLSQYYSAL